ncbi:hypothetical protein M5W83_11285 [Paenibacillus thiaminolyticus]|uniref:Uncharacterized protein n=1 Tax=Paenibacillus thiaminolyticus TaxID=49283 RepID=A0AAP9DTT8_PANTH|nr:hypothetical protein [Paenibacillus thiaminolyticus]MCY9533677.1 hypothetical protein [Paenibacillus thiaminolyticus]MCY9600899.1 hypothetical protein [Paenibacillus thiaminolyticus]MCY9607728.1 hypothetical protein [Paenibacillus thiaminolyticus]MCY9611527.1 hypothetical protein [Paenibacillus thiaminolyticus]MCY9617202.1 hypothetical protein [Paenibacillus thiaminolyticus]
MDTRSRCQELLHRQKLSQENSLAHVMDLLEHEFGIQSQIFSHSLLAIQCRLQSNVSLNEMTEDETTGKSGFERLIEIRALSHRLFTVSVGRNT